MKIHTLYIFFKNIYSGKAAITSKEQGQRLMKKEYKQRKMLIFPVGLFNAPAC